MDPLEHGSWNAEGAVSSLGARAFVADDKDTRLIEE
jgi:hypothetical protein